MAALKGGDRKMVTKANSFRLLVFYLSFFCFHSLVPGRNRMFTVSGESSTSSSSSQLFSTYTPPSPSGLYLERMVERKKIEVNQLLSRHDKPDDPIFMRMTYMASENKYNVTRFVLPIFNPSWLPPPSVNYFISSCIY